MTVAYHFIQNKYSVGIAVGKFHFCKKVRMRTLYKIFNALVVFFIGASIGSVAGIVLIIILTVESDVSGFLEKSFIVVPICALIGGLGSLFVFGPMGQRE
ncbi:hypothetical protein [Mesorhizobium sp. ES1-4]|uniref:hypothetical protein n=1 Tax=Mesorhizobium sp. ES1-4 TaxID=2876627 RepID=UPI001CCC849E|nr:hypothetical protein [Mesorhizobium sp. ES1-4]MBZ9794581.1 hypothetical protein [Mesorhizobium sp. ES1-4]